MTSRSSALGWGFACLASSTFFALTIVSAAQESAGNVSGSIGQVTVASDQERNAADDTASPRTQVSDEATPNPWRLELEPGTAFAVAFAASMSGTGLAASSATNSSVSTGFVDGAESGAAPSQEDSTRAPATNGDGDGDGEHAWFVEAGIGLTADPDTILMALTAGKSIRPGLTVGPTLQLGVSDDETIFAPTLGLRRTFDLERFELDSLATYVEGGVGLAYLEEDHRVGDDDEVGFLVNFGIGANVTLNQNVTLGTGFLVNLMPGEVLDDRVFVSWRILQLTIPF